MKFAFLSTLLLFTSTFASATNVSFTNVPTLRVHFFCAEEDCDNVDAQAELKKCQSQLALSGKNLVNKLGYVDVESAKIILQVNKCEILRDVTISGGQRTVEVEGSINFIL